jgi:hypothetical protein
MRVAVCGTVLYRSISPLVWGTGDGLANAAPSVTERGSRPSAARSDDLRLHWTSAQGPEARQRGMHRKELQMRLGCVEQLPWQRTSRSELARLGGCRPANDWNDP